MSLLGVFGGTFDPVHHGHLRCAWELAEQFAMPVHMIPSFQPVHRSRPGATPKQRMAMLRLALGEQDRLVADGRELDRGGPSFMVDTLASIREEFPDHDPCLIVGMDAFKAIETWKSWKTLFELAHLIVMTRPGEIESLPNSLERWVSDRWASDGQALDQSRNGLVFRAQVSHLQISASSIRKQLASHRDPRFLMPLVVTEYIRKHRLYA
jgi:nicotinate-nucleotide adenylyltransferase